MRKVTSHSHYVTGVMSEDESGVTADNSMHPEMGKASGHADTVTTIGARFSGQKRGRAPAPKAAPKVSKSDDE